MYRYADIEAAVAGSQRIPDEGLGAFRARLRHLRNQGVPDVPRPGKGRAVHYTLHHAAQLAFALELEAISVPPHQVAELVRHAWANTDVPRFIKELPPVSGRGDPGPPRFLVMELNFISEIHSDGAHSEAHHAAFDVLGLHQMMAYMRQIGGDRRAAAVINLTAAGHSLRMGLPWPLPLRTAR